MEQFVDLGILNTKMDVVVTVNLIHLVLADLNKRFKPFSKRRKKMNDDALEEMAREILNGNMCEGIACPEHGFKFITMSDGDGHPASWHYFCDHESHEEEHELIDGKVWISKRVSYSLDIRVRGD